ncbi:hypothetical protein NOF04DRAFT_1360203 [Fusarium oxysporum II5]|nr:hypothetical protein NOF04DRAFT_1360203 [Fusarium oxysporum II5]
MATSSNIWVTTRNTGLWKITQNDEAARKASKLPQRDLREHHVFLNKLGFHDHMSHRILALYGTGASAEQMGDAYQLRDSLERSIQPRHVSVVDELNTSWDNCIPFLGKEEYYPDFLPYTCNIYVLYFTPC